MEGPGTLINMRVVHCNRQELLKNDVRIDREHAFIRVPQTLVSNADEHRHTNPRSELEVAVERKNTVPEDHRITQAEFTGEK